MHRRNRHLLARSMSPEPSFALALGATAAAASSNPAVLSGAASPTNNYELIVPERWEMRVAGEQTVLTSPEGDISLWFGMIAGKDIEAAVAAAWSSTAEAVPAPERISPAPARPGFSEAQLFNYTPEGETIRQVRFDPGGW